MYSCSKIKVHATESQRFVNNKLMKIKKFNFAVDSINS